MTFEIYKLEWILSRHTFGNTTIPSFVYYQFTVFVNGIYCIHR